jgi:hypothetical protein
MASSKSVKEEAMARSMVASLNRGDLYECLKRVSFSLEETLPYVERSI